MPTTLACPACGQQSSPASTRFRCDCGEPLDVRVPEITVSRALFDDRLSALAKYTYFHNVPTTDQLGAQGTPAEFIQKSHIAAFDLTYDLTAAWSIGGKYAYRRGEVSLDRERPDYFDNSAHLVILRADWRFMKDWESSLEGRTLIMPSLNEQKSGAMFTVYRYLGKHLKIGVGYNFTDFSDDLTDLSYDRHGLFFNLVLPGLNGGDVARGVLVVRENPGRRPDALMSVVVDRLIGLVAMIALALLAVLSLREQLGPLVLPVSGAALAAFGGLAVLQSRRLRGNRDPHLANLFIGPDAPSTVPFAQMTRPPSTERPNYSDKFMAPIGFEPTTQGL